MIATTIVLVVSPSLNVVGRKAYSTRGPLFDGKVDGRWIVKRSTTPFCDADELAHLCLHKHGGANTEHIGDALEKEANAFASAFLMPETDVKAICNRPLYSVNDLADYKKRWRVSAAALNYRLRELGMISDGKSTSNYVEMSRRGWLKAEPNGIAREQSSVLQDIVNDLIGQGITKTKIAAELMVPLSEIEALLFGLANMTTIDGAANPTPRRDVKLKLVK